MVITDRDKEVLRFTAKWRFVTLEQLQKANIFNTSSKKAYNRLLVLRGAKLLKASRLGGGKMYYYLAPLGGEVIGLPHPWHSKIYRNANLDTVLKCLTACDFALAAGIDYLERREVFERLKASDYGVLVKCLRTTDLFFEKGGVLNVLIIDYQYSLKYLMERVKLYSRLPVEVREQFMINILVFDQTRREQIFRVAGAGRVRIKVLKANWKY